MFSRKVFSALAFALLASSSLAASAAPRYTLTFLPRGFEPGPFHPLNNEGSIVGTYQGRVAIFDHHGLQFVKAPPAVGEGINDRSDVTGRLTGSNTAFAIIGGKLVDVHATLPSLYFTSEGYVINNRDSVAGIADPFVDEAVRGFLYRQGHSEIIPTLGGDFSFVRGLNNKDAVVGYASTGTGPVNDPRSHAYVYKDGKIHDLGTLGTGQRSEAFDINDHWQIVGESRIVPDNDVNPVHPFLFQNGRMSDLGTLGGSFGTALGINNAGLIVGGSSGPDEVVSAFLYLNGKMLDLNKLTAMSAGWRLVDGLDINDKAQIIGTACYGFGGECRPVRLDPVCSCRSDGTGHAETDAMPKAE